MSTCSRQPSAFGSGWFPTVRPRSRESGARSKAHVNGHPRGFQCQRSHASFTAKTAGITAYLLRGRACAALSNHIAAPPNLHIQQALGEDGTIQLEISGPGLRSEV